MGLRISAPLLAIGSISVLGMLPGMLPQARASGGNPLFGHPHMQGSPLTLPAGRVVAGSSAAIGLTDFAEVGTNVVSDLYQVYNASAKVQLLSTPDVAAAISAGYQSYNPRNLVATNPDMTITSWQPGATVAFALDPRLAAFVGGYYNSTTATLTGTSATSYAHGTTSGADLAWAYSPGKKSLGNVLAVGATYDFDYQLYGVGLTHYWRTLRLGIHYYPNATQSKVLPIIAGSAAFDL